MVAAQVKLLAPQLNLLRARRPLCASGGIGNGQVEAVAEAEDVAAFGFPCLRGVKDVAEASRSRNPRQLLPTARRSLRQRSSRAPRSPSDPYLARA
jgi:hypothetical protein